jgi:thioesterase domain-containing protein
VESYRAEPSGLRATLIRVDEGPIELMAADLFAQLDVHVVGGDHLTMLDAEHAPEIVAILRSVIASSAMPIDSR